VTEETPVWPGSSNNYASPRGKPLGYCQADLRSQGHAIDFDSDAIPCAAGFRADHRARSSRFNPPQGEDVRLIAASCRARRIHECLRSADRQAHSFAAAPSGCPPARGLNACATVAARLQTNIAFFLPGSSPPGLSEATVLTAFLRRASEICREPVIPDGRLQALLAGRCAVHTAHGDAADAVTGTATRRLALGVTAYLHQPRL